MSIQIVEKSGEGLSRLYGVTIAAADLGEKLDARIKEIAPQLQLKGFRPGKVPAAHVRRLYGKSLMGEVVEQTLNESSQKVLADNNLRPASQPDLTPSSDMEKVLAGQEDLAFDMAIEVMPEFEPIDPAKIDLEKPVYAPTDAEIDAAVAELAQQNRTYATRTGKSVKAKDGDMLVIGRQPGARFGTVHPWLRGATGRRQAGRDRDGQGQLPGRLSSRGAEGQGGRVRGHGEGRSGAHRRAGRR
jgi:trigger factor